MTNILAITDILRMVLVSYSPLQVSSLSNDLYIKKQINLLRPCKHLIYWLLIDFDRSRINSLKTSLWEILMVSFSQEDRLMRMTTRKAPKSLKINVNIQLTKKRWTQNTLCPLDTCEGGGCCCQLAKKSPWLRVTSFLNTRKFMMWSVVDGVNWSIGLGVWTL